MKERIGSLIAFGLNYWRPLHQRMDYWAGMYFMLDQIQQMKPLGYRRFISNEPRTAVDTAVSIMTRNDTFWRIDLNEETGENSDERLHIGKIERTLQGIVSDMDELFSMRGEMPFWKQISYQALLRGWIWGKAHVTTSALEYRESPMIAQIYDSYLVLPHFDGFGLESVIIRDPTTLGALASIYPEEYEKEVRDSKFDPNRPAEKIEFWSNNRGTRPGISGTLAVLSETRADAASYATPNMGASLKDARWLIPPYVHGYPPQALPVVGTPVNGVNLKVKPAMISGLSNTFRQRSDVLGVNTRFWQGPGTQIAESGRSILSAVEEQVPQFNELIATIFQHFSLGTYGTWIFRTPTGELPKFQPNIDARIPLRPEESIERLTPEPISQDAFRLMEILRQEQQQGTLSSILRASLPVGGSDVSSGILFSQMTSAALNALEPYTSGAGMFGQRMMTSVLLQMQMASREIKAFTVSVPGQQHSYFAVQFDPAKDLERGRKYKARPIFRPALPDDMHIRINMARLALDPRRPILSLTTVMESILMQEDPEAEKDRIWEDLANQDPVIVLEQIAQALERYNEPEMAARIRENQMRARLIEDLQFRQLTGSVPGQGGPPGGGPPDGGPPGGGQPPGPGPETGQQNARNEIPAASQRSEGAALVGAIGERSSV